jgi:hypothetical protein
MKRRQLDRLHNTNIKKAVYAVEYTNSTRAMFFILEHVLTGIMQQQPYPSLIIGRPADAVESCLSCNFTSKVKAQHRLSRNYR